MRTLFKIAVAGLAFGLTAFAGTGCEEGAGTTTGKRVALHTRIAAAPNAASFSTAFGWKVKLSKAAAALGGLYYFDGVPAFVHLAPARPERSRFARFFGIGVAHAHPGHYEAGNALGEMTEASSFDLLGSAAALADGKGVSGDYRSASFVFAAHPEGPAASALEGHGAIAEGTAEKSDGSSPKPIYFRVAADFDEIAAEAKDGKVEGCAFDEAQVEADGTVTVTITPTIWFDYVDFTDVDPGSAESPTELEKDSTAKAGFVLGLVQLSAYSFAYAH